MPSKSKRAKAKSANRSLWQEAGSDNLFTLLCERFPSNQWLKRGDHIIGCCPYHQDDKPSFIVSPNKGIAKCFGCSVVYLDFLYFVKSILGTEGSILQAAQILRKRFNIKTGLTDAQCEKLKAEEDAQIHLRKFLLFCGETLIKAVTLYPTFESAPEYFFAKDALEGYRDRRYGWPSPNELRPAGEELPDPEAIDPYGLLPGIVKNQLLAVIPPMALINNHYRDDREGLAFTRKYWGPFIESGGGYQGYHIFPFHTAPNVLGCFKVRAPQRELKKMFFVGRNDEGDNSRFFGYYGLHNYRAWLGPQSMQSSQTLTRINMVEGEPDALQVMAQQHRLGGEDVVVLAIGGESLQAPNMLVAQGITRVYINQDRDHGGDNMVENLLRRTTSSDINYFVFQWPKEYAEWRDPTNPDSRIKDPDDAVTKIGYPRWRRYACSSEHYVSAMDWVFDKANHEMESIPATDLRHKSKVAIEWGRLLLDRHESRGYVKEISEAHKLEAPYLLQCIYTADEGEEAFVERLLGTLEEHVHFVGTKTPEPGKRIIVFYNKTRKLIDSLPVGDLKAVDTTFAAYFGPLYEFVAREMGEPAFMAPKNEDGDAGSAYNLSLKTKKYSEYINFALQRAVPLLPSLDHTPLKAQGYHYMHERDGVHTSYVVNGGDVYHIAQTATETKVAMLDGPSHEDVLFNTRDGKWLESLTEAKQLVDDAAMSPLEIFETMRDMLDTAWGWEHGGTAEKIDATFLAAFCMCVPVMNAFSRQVAIILNAEKQSGKSRFLGGFLGGHEFKEIHMVAHTVVMNGYTEPAIRQQRDGSTLCLCLEEFEDDGSNDRRSMVVRRSLELFRDLISEAEVRWSVGSTSGRAREYRLRFPLACTAIHPLRDGASLSRFVPFTLKHDTAKADPLHVILERWGAEKCASVKHCLGVGLYKHVPRLRELQKIVRAEYSSGALLPAYVPARFREALVPILTMLRFLSEQPGGASSLPSYQQFAVAFSESRKNFLTQLHTTSVNEEVFQSLLESPFQVIGADAHKTTIRSMLGNANGLDEINQTKQGVYFDKQMNWLVVPWIQACQGVLQHTPFKSEKPVYLKKVAERSPHHVDPEEAKASGVLRRLRADTGPGMTYDLVTVFSVKHLMIETQQMWSGGGGTAHPEPKAPADAPDGNSGPTHIDDMGV